MFLYSEQVKDYTRIEENCQGLSCSKPISYFTQSNFKSGDILKIKMGAKNAEGRS